jgi:transcriptional regulator with GAF, ATPase, and Fis domain
VGGTDRIPVDIRIIAATNRDLAMMVRDGRFREDLFFRLRVFPITVPPLRERADDIPALVQFFIERKAKELKIGDTPPLGAGAIDALMDYHWPGNVRELENVVERAMILHRGDSLRFDDLGNALSKTVSTPPVDTNKPPADLDTVIREHVIRVLNMTQGKIHGAGGAAELLGVHPSTLRNRMNKLGIRYGRAARPGDG